MVVDDIKAIAGVLNQALNPASQSHRQIGTTGPLFAILFSLAAYYFLPESIIINVIVNMIIFLFFIRGFRKWIYVIALFQFFLYIFLGQISVPASQYVYSFVGLFLILPIWPAFGVIVFMGAVQNAENRGMAVPPLAKMFYFFWVFILIAIFVSHFYTQFYTPIPSDRLAQAREVSIKIWNFITTNVGNAFKIIKYTFSCWMEQVYLGKKVDIDTCVKEKMSPGENETIQGGTDKTIQEVVKADLRNPPYLATELGTEEAFEVGAVLDVFNPKKEKLDIEVKCKIKNEFQREIPSRISGTQGQTDATGGVVIFKDVDRLYSDLVCRPAQTTSLGKGRYTVSFEATIKNIKTEAKLVNLFMARDALRSLITDYAKERKITVTSKTEASVMRALFPGLIATYYPQGKVESKSEQSFLRAMAETRTTPIIGYIPGEVHAVGLKVGAQNLEKGTPGKATISFTLPDDMEVIPSECKEYKKREGSENVYEYVKKVDLSKLKYNGAPTALPRCFVDVGGLNLINPNVPEPRTFIVEFVYDYTLKKDLNVRVRAYGYESLGATQLPKIEWKKCSGVFPLTAQKVRSAAKISDCARDSDGGTVKFDTFKKYYEENKLSDNTDLDLLLVLALAQTETGCNPSPDNEQGIMQVPNQGNLNGMTNLDKAINLGTAELKARFDDVKAAGYSGENAVILALYGYNRGKGSMDRAIELMKTGKSVNEAMLLACYEKYDAGAYKGCSGFDRNACCGAPGNKDGRPHNGEGLGARYPEKVINHYKDACMQMPGGALS